MRVRLVCAVLVVLAASGCTSGEEPSAAPTKAADACAGFVPEVRVTSSKARTVVPYQLAHSLPPASSSRPVLQSLDTYTASVRLRSGRDAEAGQVSEVIDRASDRAGSSLATAGSMTPPTVPFPRQVRNDTDFNLTIALFRPVQVWSGSWETSTCDASTGERGRESGRWTSWRMLRPEAVPCGSRPRSTLAAHLQRGMCA